LRFREETDIQKDSSPGRSNPVLSLVQYRTWRAPTEQEIASYKHDYRQWEGSVRNALPKMAGILDEVSHEIPFAVVVANGGYVNGTDVRLTVTGFDGVYLLATLDEDDAAKRIEKLLLPSPPKAPRGHYMNLLDAFGPGHGFDIGGLIRDYSALQHLRPRDPNRFYYVDGRPQRPVAEVERECKALPHQVDPNILKFRAVIQDDELGSKPRLRVRVRASNLKKPIETYLPVSVSTKSGNFERRLMEIQQARDKA
jgi:hypothetical protein